MQQEIQQLLSHYPISQVHSALYEEMLDTYLYLSSIYQNPVCCIYAIYHKSTNKCIYVGATLDLNNRISWHHHEYKLFPKRKLYSKIQKTGGWDSYKFKLLESIENIAFLYNRERYYIQLLSPSSNMLSPPNKKLQ
jgi:hypothetical protein